MRAAARALLVLCCAVPAAGQGTNLEILQRLAGSIGAEIAASARLAPADSVDLRAPLGRDAWIAQTGVAAALRTAGFAVFTVASDSAGTRPRAIDLHSAVFAVQYDDPQGGGLFGGRRVRRTINAAVSYEARSRSEIVAAGTLARSAADTIDAGAAAALEDPSLPVTHGELPPERFLDRIAEPFIIIGATGVAVYLLFHVRS